MADPNTITADGLKEATKATKELSNTTKEAAESGQALGSVFSNIDSMSQSTARSLLGLNEAGFSTKTMLGSIGEQLNKVKEYMNSNVDASTKASLAFAGVSIAIAGTRKSFQEFQQSNPMLNTISDPLNEMIGLLTKSGASAGTMESKLAEIGIKVPPGITRTKTAIIDFAKGIAESADNTFRLQSGLFQMSASTGSLNEVTSAAGDEFERMNNLLSIHDSMIRTTQGDTFATAAAAESYYMALGKVHGALGSTVTSARDSNDRVSMLSATMQYAAGSGRSQQEVIEDLQTAYKNMGMEGENALKFTARMGEISNKFGIELSEVRRSLNAATTDLMRFGGEGMKSGNIIQGAARIMNDYIGALKSTGISGAQAVGIVQEMTNKIAGLGVAERSFLSQRSGGPGGLRGAFQIENMIKEGNIDEVMRKVQSTMQQQFGKIVTGEEAAKSEDAASRAIMQRQMLQAGPLGGFAKSEQDAARILEAFAARSEGKISEKELSDTILPDTMDKGLKFQELTYNDIHAVRTMMEQSRGIANIAAAGLVQQVGTARVGTRDYINEPAVPEEEENRANLIRFQERNRRLGAERAMEIGNRSNNGAGESGAGSLGKVANETMGSWADVISSAPTVLMAPIKRMKALIDSGDSNKVEDEFNSFNERIAQKRQEMLAVRSESEKDRLNAEIADLTYIKESSKAYKDSIEYASNINNSSNQTPAVTVKTAAQATSNVRSAEVAAAEANEREAAATTTTTEGTEPLDINLHIETACVNCGTKIRSSHQDVARSPTSRTSA